MRSTSDDVRSVLRQIDAAPTCRHCARSIGTHTGGLMCIEHNETLVPFPAVGDQLIRRQNAYMEQRASNCEQYGREPGAD